nr:hypothetical protein [Bacteroidales bacterium]
MKRLIQVIFLLVVFVVNVSATHNRAGEITLTQLGEYTYEILITTFTYTESQADRASLEVQWGDNTYSSAPRISITRLPNFYQKNIYVAQHTFPGAGTYEMVVQDPNRNLGVKNIPNSVNVVFSIKTTISINPSIGLNSTPVLLNPPLDRAALNQIFIHNPAAYDPDGDSISYKLTVCTEEDGKPIENYTLPSYDDTLFIDEYTGDLTWIRPNEIGIYNIAIDIEEWRRGVKIGNIVRDMQIEVYDTDNTTPKIDSLPDFCVEAGTDIAFRLYANDIDNDSVRLSAAGGPFAVKLNQAAFSVDKSAATLGHSEGDFLWQTDCSHVRNQFYTAVFKAEDNNPETKLVDLKNVNILVIGSAPSTPDLSPASNSILLNWEIDPCPYVTGYKIFRKKGPSGYVPDSCVSGVPAYTGYTGVATVNSRIDTIYFDDNYGRGLEQGYEYCYMIASIYPDGALSYPSGEACTPLIAGIPSLLQASVTKHSTAGDIELRWAKSDALDTIPGPYEYVITRYSDLFGNTAEQVYSKFSTDKNDTIFLDNEVNTETFPHAYSFELYSNDGGNRIAISDTSQLELASSLSPELIGGDNQIKIKMKKNVPWINYNYTVFRASDESGTFDKIGLSTDPVFIDKRLKNNKEYCYRIVSTGWRSTDSKFYENSNISHIACTQAIDTTPPCTPILSGQSFCDEFYNLLTWRFAADSCLEDVVAYNLYYSPTEDGTPLLIEGYKGDKSDTSYIDMKTEESLTGCYYLTAVDSFANESPMSVQLCL